MRRIWGTRTETRRYAATVLGGARRDVTVFDRDQQAARRALPAGAAENPGITPDVGVATPRLRALIQVGPESAVLANEHHDGTTLAEQDGKPTGEQLRRVWDAVLQLHQHRVTHRNRDRILFASPWLRRRRRGHAARAGQR
jgi:hypothetical protein